MKKGTVLVSGQVPVLNDAKEVTGYQYHQADADITGITTLEYEENCDDYYEEKKYESISKKQTGIKEEYLSLIHISLIFKYPLTYRMISNSNLYAPFGQC